MARTTVCGILYSEYVECAVSPGQAAAAARAAARAAGTPVRARKVRAESPGDLARVDVLINTMGPHYCEPTWNAIVSCFEAGGVILSVGPRPFTVPYVVGDDGAQLLPATDAALHTLRVLDCYHPSGPAGPPMTLEALQPRYAFLERMAEEGTFPEMADTWSADIHLATRGEGRGRDSVPLVEADLEPVCCWRDHTGRRAAVPILRLDRYDMGALILMNFAPADPGYYETDAGLDLLSGLIATALQPRVQLAVESSYARYRPDETPQVRLALRQLGPSTRRRRAELSVEAVVTDAATGREVKGLRFPSPRFRGGLAEASRRLPGLSNGQYTVTATLWVDGAPALTQRTGFHKVSDRALRTRIRKCAPVLVDRETAPDFGVRDGQPFPMHGVNYFVTGLGQERDCFLGLNVAHCDEELAELSRMGANCLRTGIWQRFGDVFQEDGRIREPVLRSFEALLLTAAKYDLPVRFVLGCTHFDNWDRTRSYVHDPWLRRRVHNVFESFVDRLKGLPLVQIDVINEPSYSTAGLWSTARPAGGPDELRRWRQWLRERYADDISALRAAWGMTATEVPDFDTIEMPAGRLFGRGYDRLDHRMNYVPVNDFFRFAREWYDDWVAEYRDVVKRRDPDMLFMIGRDEPLRIPEQHYEVHKGRYDIVGWHHWHRDSIIFIEYCLNRCRGVPTVAQEIGTYYFKDQRNMPRLSDEDCRNMSEKKFLYSLGNWLQWNAYADATNVFVGEIKLGIFRPDKTERPHTEVVRLLSWLEDRMAPHYTGRDEDAIDILTVHPSQLYFSVDSHLAYVGTANSMLALQYHLKLQSDYVMEHLFRPGNEAQIGRPKLIVVPALQTMSDEAWGHLLRMVEDGATAVVSGCADVDGYWRHTDRLAALGLKAETVKASTAEEVRIGRTDYSMSFRECVGYLFPGNALNRTAFADQEAPAVRTKKLGKGKLLLCPLPVELADSIEPTLALYAMAARRAGVANNVCGVQGTQPHIFLYPIRYADSTAYTLINESGSADEVRFTDVRSSVKVSVKLKPNRGAKVVLDSRGRLLGAYINGELSVGDLKVIPNGNLSLARDGRRWRLLPGRRDESWLQIGERRAEVPAGDSFVESSSR
jgi:hypothetical protein